MFDFFDRLYGSTDFMPHGDCLVWDPVLLWQHIGSDIVTGLSYYLIAATLFYFVVNRRDLPYWWVFLLFGAFILSCGTTHFMAAWTIYYPSYWTEGILKTINAVISFATAIVLIPLLPKLLKLPGLQDALTKLKASDKRYEELVERTNDLITCVDGQGNFTFVNKIAEKYLGCSPNECIGSPAFDFIHPDDRKSTEEWFKGCSKQKLSVATFENRQVNTKTNEVFNMLWTCNLAYDDQGKLQNMTSIARDITKRKLMAEEIQKSRAEFEAIFLSITDAIVFVDLQRHIIRVNPAFTSIFGYQPEELLGQTTQLIYADPATYLQKGQERYRPGAQAEKPLYDNKYRRKDGTIFTGETLGVPVKDASGEVMGFLGVIRDISERKAIEETLQRHEQKYRTVTDNVTDVIWTQNMQGDFTFISPSWETQTGFTIAEGLAMNNRDLLTPDSYAQAMAYFKQRLDTDGERKGTYYPSFTIELEHIRKDGSTFWSEVTAKFLRDPSGNPAGLTGVTRDISERKQAEKALLRGESLAQKYLDVAEVMLVALDKKGKITLINHKGCELLEISEREALGKNWFHHFIPKAQEEEVLGVFNQLMTGKMALVRHYQNKVLTNTGKELLVAFHNSILTSADDEIEGVIFSGEDISAREKILAEKANLENQLRQAQKMEAVGTLAGGIAHDFNNILSIILGYTDLAKEDAPPGSAYVKDLNQVLEAGYRAKDLVRQILSFSRQVQVKKIVLQPQLIIKESLKMLRSSIPTTIEIQENIAPDCGNIEADPTQLHQILMNLCTNAFHTMEDKGGILTVDLQVAATIPPELQNETGEKSFLELSVTDTGQGIGPDIINKIFDPFFTTKEQGKGTGMGLAIAYGIAKDYGGTITVDSCLGKGTSVHVYLPQSKGKEAEKSPERDISSRGQERILFVDDEEILATLGKDMLERLGYRVTTKKSSIEALEAFQNQPDQFDLVITDQTMPGLTGLDLARRILQIRPDIPIILSTGYSSMVNEEVARAQGIKAFALKPLTRGATAKLVRQILDEVATAG